MYIWIPMPYIYIHIKSCTFYRVYTGGILKTDVYPINMVYRSAVDYILSCTLIFTFYINLITGWYCRGIYQAGMIYWVYV